jgi:hypothetical protein
MTSRVLGLCLCGALLGGCAAAAAPSGIGLRDVGQAVAVATERNVQQARADGVLGYAHADSRFGHGSVSGPVRRGPRGLLEVRMPGGTWIDCGRSCSDTLRRETVDFWENHGGPNATGDGVGYLTWRR